MCLGDATLIPAAVVTPSGALYLPTITEFLFKGCVGLNDLY